MAEIVLKNGLVDVGGGEFRRADVAIEGGRIASVGDSVHHTRPHVGRPVYGWIARVLR